MAKSTIKGTWFLIGLLLLIFVIVISVAFEGHKNQEANNTDSNFQKKRLMKKLSSTMGLWMISNDADDCNLGA